jgi:hypothetical protein
MRRAHAEGSTAERLAIDAGMILLDRRTTEGTVERRPVTIDRGR